MCSPLGFGGRVLRKPVAYVVAIGDDFFLFELLLKRVFKHELQLRPYRTRRLMVFLHTAEQLFDTL